MTRVLTVLGALAGAALFASAPGYAAPIDFSFELTQLDGKPFTGTGDMTDQERAVVAPLLARGYTLGKPEKTTLGSVAINSLLYPVQGDDPTEKMKKYGLALKIQDATANKLQEHSKVDLTVDELKMVKDAIGKLQTPLIVGQAWRVLDPASVPK